MLAAPIPENESLRLESLRRMLSSYAPDQEALDRVTRAACRMFGAPIAVISLVDRDRQWFKSCVGLTVHETPRDISFCGHAILQDEMLIVEDALRDPRFADNPMVTEEPKMRFYAGRPLRNSENFKVGALCIIDREPRTLSPEERRMLDDLGTWAEEIFASRQLTEARDASVAELDEARRESMVDPLLQIWNRCAIVDALDREIQRALRHHDPLSVLMVEVDELASIEDRYGPQAADAVLKEAARAISTALRPYDAVGRYGKGAFLVVLPDTQRTAAAAIALRLRKKVAASTVPVGGDGVSCTLSTGAAWIDRTANAWPVDTLVASAADALQLAKLTGYHRTEYDEDLPQHFFHASRRFNRPVRESTSDEAFGNALFAAQLARLRACVVDD